MTTSTTTLAAAGSSQLDFVALKSTFDTALGNGQRADIRRVRIPDELALVPAVYRLLPPGQRPTAQWLQVIYFLPYLKQSPGAESLGKQFAIAQINEMRLFQVVRSESPNDLTYLRRLVQQVEPIVDWANFGKTIFFWNTRNKRRLLEDYFMAAQSKR